MEKVTKLSAEQIRELEAANDKGRKTGTVAENATVRSALANMTTERDALQAKLAYQIEAIRQTLEENRHLADGDNCTLLVLKRAYEASK